MAAAGNAWIPASVYDIILNVVDGGMPAQRAIEAPRFLVGRDPVDNAVGRIQIEDRIPRAILAGPDARGPPLHEDRPQRRGALRLRRGRPGRYAATAGAGRRGAAPLARRRPPGLRLIAQRIVAITAVVVELS